MDIEEHFLVFCKKQFAQYKLLAEKAIAQIDAEKLFIQVNNESNSIAMIVQHMAGNMLSRWTNFLTTDGEKDWRKRDEEFEVVLKKRRCNEGLGRGLAMFICCIEQRYIQSIKRNNLYSWGGAFSFGSHQQTIGPLPLSCGANSFYCKNVQ